VSFQFVNLDPARLDEFCSLYLSVFNAPPWNDGWTHEVVAERLGAFARFPDFLAVAAFEGEVPVGLALGWPERWVNGWHFHLKEMLVANEHRRRGVGAGLMQQLERSLAERNIKCVYLETSPGSAAQRFYEQLGFKPLALTSMAKSVSISDGEPSGS
jgi:aminoglycoside 6'-N-acetyltransferase I